MDGGGKAERWLDDRDDADLHECVADLIDRRIIGQEILSDVRRPHRLRRLRLVIILILGESGVIKEAYGKTLLVHALDEYVFPDCVDADRAILALPGQARLSVGHVCRI